MATLTELRNAIITSIRGRRMGFDHNDWLMGPKGTRLALQAATSDTTGTNLQNYGIVELASSTDDTWVLDDPVEGGSVTIRCASTSTSTGVKTVNSNNATFVSSASSTSGSLSLTGNNHSITLYGQSTAIWSMTSRTGTSAQVHIST